MTGEPAGGRFVRFAGGYPQLCRDVTRNLTRGVRLLAADADTGTVVTAAFDRDPDVLARCWYEITAARAVRNLEAGRPVGLTGWRRAWGQASELATLRVGGQLAAWLIARPGPHGYAVLGGQMVHRHRRRRPGTVLEALVMARAMAGPQPWPPLPGMIEDILKAVQVTQHGAGYAACAWLDWGPGHPDKLLTRPGGQR